MLLDRISIGTIDTLGIGKVPVVSIEQENIGEDLAHGNEVTATSAGFPIEDRAPTVEGRVRVMRLLIRKGRTDQSICLTLLGLRYSYRWLRFFGQHLALHKWCLAVYAYAAVGRAGRFSQYTQSGVRPSSARCGLS